MTTPAKFLKNPDTDTDLSELNEDELQKLASGLVKRTIKLMLAESEERGAAWDEPVLAFLRACAYIGLTRADMAGAMCGVLQKDGPPEALETLLALAEAHRNSDETIGAYLTAIRATVQGDVEEAKAFRARCDQLEDVLQA